MSESALALSFAPARGRKEQMTLSNLTVTYQMRGKILSIFFLGLLFRRDTELERDFGAFREIERLEGHECSFDKTRAQGKGRRAGVEG